MLPPQSGGMGPSNSYAGVSSPDGYPTPPSPGQLGQAGSYSPQPQQMIPTQQYPQQFQQSPPTDLQSQPAQQAGLGPVTAPTEHQQLQQQQQSLSTGGASSPTKGLMRIFARKHSSEANITSPPQPTSSATLPPSSTDPASPERRGILGIFGSRGNATVEQQQQLLQQQQQQQQQQVQQAQEALQSLQLEQGASAQQPGIYPPVPGTSVEQAPLLLAGGVAGLPGGAPVVPPPGGLCSRPPPPADEVARLQSGPLGPSKFVRLNTVPSSSSRGRSASSPGAAAAAPAVDPQFSGPAPLEEKYGPYLRYGGYDPVTRIYSASVMMVIHQSRSRYPPKLKYRDTQRQGTREEIRDPVLLWSYAGYNFWRWDVAFQLGPSPTVVEYYVVCSEDHWFTPHPRHSFHLPAAGQKWHWGFYSCNGFHDHNDEICNGGIQPMWRDVMHVHARDPLHVLFGGGDQLYCDDVWKVDSLVKWLSIQDKPSRNAHPFSQDMVNEVFDFYFRNYTTHFSKEVFRDALASIPQVMIWDDHDIFDGWGSYPPELQKCSVFAGVYFVARKFYLLFQCHAAENNYRDLNKGWGLTGLSWTMMLGNTTAVVGLDSRGERTREQIIRPASWAAFADQVAKLPAGVRHVVVLATVPLVYPTVPGIEEAMMALAGTGLMVGALTAFLQKTGLSSQIYSHFGEPELLDDLLDHWSARAHEMEKYCFVRMMQDLAQSRGFRFSILSGDVHCAGVAAFQTMPKVNLKTDHRHVVQVISSAIGNVPPPDAVITALTASNKPKMLDARTREKMRCIFENNGLLKASRNWCDVHERPLLQGGAATAAMMAGGVSGGPADGSLWFQLRVEHPLYKEVRPYMYDIVVPVLELLPGSFSALPLPVAPPLPQPLMQKFQEELVAAGVGLDAALPVEGPQHGSTSSAQPGQQLGQQQASMNTVLYTPARPQKAAVSYPPQGSAPYLPQASVPYPQQDSALYPPQGSLPHPPQGSAPYPPQDSAPYLPQGSVPYPPQGSVPYPPQGSAPYPPQDSVSHPPQSSAPYAPQGSAPYPPQGSVPYPQPPPQQQNSGQQEFGLQSDIVQQQQQQQSRGLPLALPPQAAVGMAAGPAPGSYPAMPPMGMTMVPSGGLHANPPARGPSPPLPLAQVTQASSVQSFAAHPAPTYGGGVAAMPPQAGMPGAAYAPMTGPAPTSYASQVQPQQQSYPSHMQPHPQQGQMPYPMHYQLQQPGTAVAVPYPQAGSAYPLQGPSPSYPHPGNPPYTGGTPPYGTYPSY